MRIPIVGTQFDKLQTVDSFSVTVHQSKHEALK